jgi:fumarate reductase flavoprotein subunit
MSPGRDFDLVVAGAGGAGSVAALTAADEGLSVLLLDQLAAFRRGCNTYMSTSMIPAAGTRWQRAAAIDDAPAVFHDDIMRKTKGAAYPVLARALTEVGSELVDWLADVQGLPLELATDFNYPGHSRQRCHTLPERSGHVLHGHLMRRVEASAGITIAAPMELRSVTLDTAGAIEAATVATPGGADETVPTGAVVLATGGFGANPELVRALIPEIAGALYFGSEGCTGDALRIGRSLHADTGYLDAYQGHGSVATPHGIMVTWATVMHGGVLVNNAGQRFGDETTGYSEYAREVLKQPGGVAWVLLDERIDRLCRPFADYGDLVAQGAIAWCEDLVAAAARIGCPPAALEDTVEALERARLDAEPDAFGRSFGGVIPTAPYGLIAVTGALFHTQGGLLTDGNGAVLRDGSPIPGIYAAGGAAAGLSGHGPDGYLAGNGLLAALGLGYLAGRAISRSPVRTA